MSISSLARYRQALCDFVLAAAAARWPSPSAACAPSRAGSRERDAPRPRAVPRRRRGAAARPAAGVIWRALLAGVVVCLATAGAVSAAVLLQVDEVLDVLRAQGRAAIEIPEIDRADAGEAQTLMILGSDIRYADREARHHAALGHDPARPPGPGQGGDRDDLDPARPPGRRSRASATR